MLYFYYGSMNSSKTANLLMTRWNYLENGFTVSLIKPSVDTRDFENGVPIVKSRVGLSAPCDTFGKEDSLQRFFNSDIIMVDEAQFLTTEQVNEVRKESLNKDIYCYGLLTDFQTNLFPGSKRLVELADVLTHLDSRCSCGKIATINARYINNKICLTGKQESIESNSVVYKPMCYECYLREISNESNN